MYFKMLKTGFIYLLLHVDDNLIASGDKAKIEKLKMLLKGDFEMKDLRAVSKILGIDIRRNRKNKILYFFQEWYLLKVLIIGTKSSISFHGINVRIVL